MIFFYVPVTAKSAAIAVRGTDGKPWKTFQLSSGQGQLVVAAGALSAGTYTYTLVVDGEGVDTKTMVITR